jgi:hypothetical protein
LATHPSQNQDNLGFVDHTSSLKIKNQYDDQNQLFLTHAVSVFLIYHILGYRSSLDPKVGKLQIKSFSNEITRRK